MIFQRFNNRGTHLNSRCNCLLKTTTVPPPPITTPVEHHRMQPTGHKDIEPEPSRGVPCLGLFRKTDDWLDRTQSCAHGRRQFFSFTRVVDPALHILLLSLWTGDIKLNLGPTSSGCSKSIRCDTTHIVCSNCQRHFHRTRSRLTRSQKDIEGLARFFSSWGAVALPPTATITSTSILPCRCLLHHTQI